MWRYLTPALLLACACADQYDYSVKAVKGGDGGQFQYKAGENLLKYFGNQYNNYTQQGMRTNLTQERNYELGVCYIEVPTASLVHNPGQIPAGNGSRPELSRIRTCCKGYIRNIHNYKICDPVCSQECVNALCSAPDTCTCFPDHVKNLGGICVATCPIGCQNGHCDGGQCLCKEGFKLDAARKFCVPHCRENCGGIGNCTAPNTCECKPGYVSSPEGSCKPVCSHCTNGDCVAPNECRCRQGYALDQKGSCIPHCDHGCGPNGNCVGPNTCDYPPPPTQSLGRFPQNHLNQGNHNGQLSHTNGPYQPGNTYPHPYPQNPSNHGQQNPLNPNNQYVVNQGEGQNHLYPDIQQVQNLDVPLCSSPCLNGICVEGNRCVCNQGYVLDRASDNVCIPNCPGGCPNGICSAPNFCICNMGYYKDHSVKGSPKCTKRVRRSTDDKQPNISDLLVFEIPDEV